MCVNATNPIALALPVKPVRETWLLRLMWWTMRKSGFARYFFHRTVTEFLYDLEVVQMPGLGMYSEIREKWIERLFFLRGE